MGRFNIFAAACITIIAVASAALYRTTKSIEIDPWGEGWEKGY